MWDKQCDTLGVDYIRRLSQFDNYYGTKEQGGGCKWGCAAREILKRHNMQLIHRSVLRRPVSELTLPVRVRKAIQSVKIHRGVARNLLWGTKEEVVWERRSSSGVQGQSRSLQKPETNASYGVCGDMHPCPPWLRHLKSSSDNSA